MVQGPIPHPFIAVTGSVGKTTTKDMIAAVLSTRYRVLKTEGNYNNNIGLPLTLLRLDRSCEICVLEMGMDRPGRSTTWGRSSSRTWESSPTSGTPTSSAWAAGRTSSGPSASCCPTSGPAGWWCSTGMIPCWHPSGAAPRCPPSSAAGRRAWVPGPPAGGGQGQPHPLPDDHPRMDRQVEIPALGEHMIYPALIAAAIGERFGLTRTRSWRACPASSPPGCG